MLTGVSYFLQDPDGHYANDYKMSKYATLDVIFSCLRIHLDYIKQFDIDKRVLNNEEIWPLEKH